MKHTRLFQTTLSAALVGVVTATTASFVLPACGGPSGSFTTASSSGAGGVPMDTGAPSSTGGGSGVGGASGNAASSTSGAGESASSSSGGDPPGWVLSWSDEFNGPDGSPADDSKWTHEVNGDGGGNNERQFYTDDLAISHQQGGSLSITVTKAGASSHKCWYGTCQYLSARLVTKGKFDQAYGRFEARVQIPRGQGLWPAFWVLGANIDSAKWPGCGEIDIMENIGKEPGTNHGSMHGPGYSGGNPLTGKTTLPGNAALADAYHVYTAEWEPGVVRFYLDDNLYETKTPADVPSGKTWVYDHPFFALLNVAIGGNWPGDPDATTKFPQEMKVDYVRVYKRP